MSQRSEAGSGGAEAARGIVPRGRIGRWLHRVCRAAAIGGGLVLCAAMGLTVASVLLRELSGRPIPGDFELVELGCGIAVFAFLPYCQLVGGNIKVEFVTARLGARVRAWLDAAADLAFTAVAALLAWRLFLGGQDLFGYGETTMILGVPIWWAFVATVPSMALLALTAAYTTWTHLAGRRR